MAKLTFILIVIIAAVGGGWWYMRPYSPSFPAPASEAIMPVMPETKRDPLATETPRAIVIRHTDAGYVPAEVTIQKGEAIIFKNESAVDTWPASAMHPTHRAYPDTDITRCGTKEMMPMFDACRGIKPGESWSFTFGAPGKWGYHDHLHTRHFGSVVVEE